MKTRVKSLSQRFVQAILPLVAGGLMLSPGGLGAFPVITNVVETGGDNEATDTVAAKWTGVTFPVTVGGEPVPGLAIGASYTVGLFKLHAPSFVDRNHRYTNAVPVAMPSYLVDQEYIMIGNDNRDNTNAPTLLQLNVYVATGVRAFVLIDNRLGDNNNANPPTFGPLIMQWILDDGWTPVTTGLNRTGSLSVPDEIGIDESADGSINQYYSIYSKDFPAGVFQTKRPDAGGRNMYGVVVVPLAPPATPTGLVAVSGNAKVTLSWTAAGGATSYYVKRAPAPGGPYTPIATNTTTTYVDLGLENFEAYYYVVSAVNAIGESADSEEVIGTPKPSPQNVVAMGGTNEIALSWDTLENAVTYNVRRALAASGPYTLLANDVATTSYIDTAIEGGRTYYYTVSANLSIGSEGGLSDPVSATAVPNAPTLTAFANATTMIQLNWIATNPVISGFSLERSLDGGSFIEIATLPAVQRTYQDINLDLVAAYFYRVVATNATGWSDYSTIASAVTPEFSVNVNFANALNGQPANDPAPTPAGYVQDLGLIFADQGNGYSYGWNRDITVDGRWRKTSAAPDLRYSTLNHLMKVNTSDPSQSAIWEIEIPNGFYEVRIVGGDADNFDQTVQFTIEGLATAAYTAATDARWGDLRKSIGLSDGRLTIGSGPLARNNKICFIDIVPAVPELAVISTDPQPVEVVENRPASFSVAVASGSEPYVYQWYHDDGVTIAEVPGGTASTLTLQYPLLADAGQYFVVVTNYAGAVTSAPAALTVTEDLDPPVLLSAGSLDGTTIGLRFDELMDVTEGSVIDPANYTVNGGSVGAISATLQADGKSVVLAVDTLLIGEFTVEAAVRDRKGNLGSTSVTSQTIGIPSAADIGTGTIGAPDGDPQVLGSSIAWANGQFEITSGGSDVWGNADHFRFAYQTVSGDFDTRVQVLQLTAPDTVTKAILMARESTAAGSRNVHININPPTPARDQGEAGSRTATDGTTAAFGTSYIPVGMPNAYVRLTRSGNTFRTYRSTNDTDWVQFGETTLALPPELLVGVGVTAHTTNMVAGNYPVATGVFSGFSLTQPVADLSITKTDAPDPVRVGQTNTYTLTVNNAGPDPANQVTVTDTLPAGVTFVSATPSQGSCSQAAGVVTCTLGTVNAGASATVTLTVTAAAEGSVVNTASVISYALDPNTTDNTATTATLIYAAPVIPLGDLVYSADGGGSFTGSIPTVAGISYVVEYKNTLNDTGWTELVTIVGDGTVQPFTDPGPLPPTRFYQIRLVLP